MVRTKKYGKKSSKKKLSEFSMSDRKGSVIIGNNIPSAEKKCVKEKSKEVAEKRVLNSRSRTTSARILEFKERNRKTKSKDCHSIKPGVKMEVEKEPFEKFESREHDGIDLNM